MSIVLTQKNTLLAMDLLSSTNKKGIIFHTKQKKNIYVKK